MNKETKPTFTPGPWSVDFRPGYATGVLDASGFTIVDTNETAVLSDYHGKLNIDHWARSAKAYRELSEEEAEANARLIAAAPDMYEALKAIEAHLVSSFPPYDGQSPFEKARAALTKVEGASSPAAL